MSMFSGIVEHVGTVASLTANAQSAQMAIDIGPLAGEAKVGDSISVAGCCLTISALTNTVATFDVSSETMRKTTLQSWRAGRKANLERALAVGDRIGGHFVSGHVDGVCRLLDRTKESSGERFTFQLPEDGSVRAVEKGSIAIDGVSLTTWQCQGAHLSAALIPHTLANTTLGAMRPGDQANAEQDLIGRWVESLMRGS
jgi:riboflavin synthase